MSFEFIVSCFSMFFFPNGTIEGARSDYNGYQFDTIWWNRKHPNKRPDFLSFLLPMDFFRLNFLLSRFCWLCSDWWRWHDMKVHFNVNTSNWKMRFLPFDRFSNIFHSLSLDNNWQYREQMLNTGYSTR